MVKYEHLLKHGNEKKIVRLIHCKPFVDNKWPALIGVPITKRFLVVEYEADYEIYLPKWNHEYSEKKVIWWEPEIHEYIKSGIKDYEALSNKKEFIPLKDANLIEEDVEEEPQHIKEIRIRKNKNVLKLNKARDLFSGAKNKFIQTDDFKLAENTYLEWLDSLGLQGERLGP
jgi:hypothetical protein